MKFVEVTKLYSKYLEYFYKKNPTILALPYKQHISAIFDDCNMQSNFLEQELEKKGFETELFYYNASDLQYSWNMEIKTKDLFSIVKKQIKESKPDILYISDLFCFNEEQLKILKEELPKETIFVAWHFGILNDFSNRNAKYFDQIYTGNKYMTSLLSEYNKNTKLLYHTFSPTIINKIQKKEKAGNIVFPGSISLNCQLTRLDMCDAILRERIPFTFAGEIYGTFNPDNVFDFLRYIKFRALYKIENPKKYKSCEKLLRENLVLGKFGLDYYQFISDNLVCINRHADGSGTGTGNMRMTEVTGIGSCLLTDYREENKDLFEPDYEIVEYSSNDELAEKAKWLIENPTKAKEIALAGQKKTLNNYTYNNKAEHLIEYLQEIM